MLVLPVKPATEAADDLSFSIYKIPGMELMATLASSSGVPRLWSSSGDRTLVYSNYKTIGRLRKLDRDNIYEKTEVQLPITVDHIVADDKHLTVYGCDTYSNICRMKVANNLIDKSNIGDLLTSTVESYEKCTDQEEKRLYSQILGQMSHMTPKSAQEANRFMFVLMIYLNDIDSFIYFSTNIIKLFDLMMNFHLLDACIDNQHMRDHIEYIIRYINENIDWLRYDAKWVGVVNRFFKNILNSKRIGQYLSNQLTRSLIKSLLLVETKISLITELRDKDATVALIYAIPQTIVEEKQTIVNSVKPLQVEYQYNAVEYSVFRTVVDIDMTKGTIETRNFFKMISKFPDVDIKDKYKALVYYKYSKLFKHVLVYAVVDWANSILAYLFYGYFSGESWRAALVIPMWAILVFKVVFEIACLVADRELYVTDKWNFYDILSIAMTFFTSISLFANPNSNEANHIIKWLQWARLVSMLLLMWRSITWFRVFKPTRYIVTMILAVFKEMLAFLIFLSAFILTFAYMWRLGLAIEFDQDGSKGLSFYSSLLFAMNIIYGNAADLNTGENDKQMTVVQTILHSIGNIVIALALLNFLIAIISGVYDKISEERDLYDLKELMVLIKDFDLFWFGLSKLNPCSSDGNHQTRDRYFVLLPPENHDNIKSLRSSVNRSLMAINRNLMSIEHNLKAEVQTVVERRLKVTYEKLTDFMQKQTETLGEKLRSLDLKMESLDEKIQALDMRNSELGKASAIEKDPTKEKPAYPKLK